MLSRKTLSIILASALLLLVFSELVISSSNQPPSAKTGAPGENLCTQCHSGTVNSGNGTLSVTFGNNDTTYRAGQVYSITVSISDILQTRFGFQMTSLDNTNTTTVGSFTAVNTNTTTVLPGFVGPNARSYVSHKNAGTTSSWTFNWTAPNSDMGPLTFYLTGNATNNNGQTSGDNVYSTTFVVNFQPPPPVAAFMATPNAVCPGGLVDFVDQSTNNPTGWNWSFPGGTPSTSTLQVPVVTYSTPGTYDATLIVSNAGGSDTLLMNGAVTVHQPPSLSAFQATDPSCNGGADGGIDLFPAGNQPFSFIWSSGQTTEDLTNIAAGGYTVTVTDVNGCTTVGTYTLADPAAVTVTGSTNPATCGGSNGGATVSATGGTPGYTFAWDNGGTGPVLVGLSAGVYTVTATDASGCTVVDQFTVTNSGAPTIAETVTDVTCFGDADGEVAVVANGGSAPYTYAWSNGATTATISSLQGGTYDLTLTDGAGCIVNGSYTVNEPADLVLTTSSTPASPGGSDGSATVSTTGGTSPYTYSWTGGATDSTAMNLATGNYDVTVTDANGCSKTGSVMVSEIVGVDAGVAALSFQAYPNPVKDRLVLEFSRPLGEALQLSLVDVRGVQVMQETRNPNGAQTMELNLRDLPAGIYFVQVTVEGQQVFRRILVD